jgi:hypothetical protein
VGDAPRATGYFGIHSCCTIHPHAGVMGIRVNSVPGHAGLRPVASAHARVALWSFELEAPAGATGPKTAIELEAHSWAHGSLHDRAFSLSHRRHRSAAFRRHPTSGRNDHPALPGLSPPSGRKHLLASTGLALDLHSTISAS